MVTTSHLAGEIPINPHSLTHLGTYINSIYPDNISSSLLHTVGLRQFGIQIASMANIINLQLEQSAIQIAYANASIKYTAIYMSFSMLPMMAIGSVTVGFINGLIDNIIARIITECVFSVINGFASAAAVDALAQKEIGINNPDLTFQSLASGALGGLLGFPIFMLHNSILNNLGKRILGTSKIINWVTPLSNVAASTEASLATAVTVAKIYNQKFDPGEAAISGAVFGGASVIDHAVGMGIEAYKFRGEDNTLTDHLIKVDQTNYENYKVHNNLIAQLDKNTPTNFNIGDSVNVKKGQFTISGHIRRITEVDTDNRNLDAITIQNKDNTGYTIFATRDEFIKNLIKYKGYQINHKAINHKAIKPIIDSSKSNAFLKHLIKVDENNYENYTIRNNLISQLNKDTPTNFDIGDIVRVKKSGFIFGGLIHEITKVNPNNHNLDTITIKNKDNTGYVTFITRDEFIRGIIKYKGYKINKANHENIINTSNSNRILEHNEVAKLHPDNNFHNNKNNNIDNQDNISSIKNNNSYKINDLIEFTYNGTLNKGIIKNIDDSTYISKDNQLLTIQNIENNKIIYLSPNDLKNNQNINYLSPDYSHLDEYKKLHNIDDKDSLELKEKIQLYLEKIKKDNETNKDNLDTSFTKDSDIINDYREIRNNNKVLENNKVSKEHSSNNFDHNNDITINTKNDNIKNENQLLNNNHNTNYNYTDHFKQYKPKSNDNSIRKTTDVFTDKKTFIEDHDFISTNKKIEVGNKVQIKIEITDRDGNDKKALLSGIIDNIKDDMITIKQDNGYKYTTKFFDKFIEQTFENDNKHFTINDINNGDRIQYQTKEMRNNELDNEERYFEKEFTTNPELGFQDTIIKYIDIDNKEVILQDDSSIAFKDIFKENYYKINHYNDPISGLQSATIKDIDINTNKVTLDNNQIIDFKDIKWRDNKDTFDNFNKDATIYEAEELTKNQENENIIINNDTIHIENWDYADDEEEYEEVEGNNLLSKIESIHNEINNKEQDINLNIDDENLDFQTGDNFDDGTIKGIICDIIKNGDYDTLVIQDEYSTKVRYIDVTSNDQINNNTLNEDDNLINTQNINNDNLNSDNNRYNLDWSPEISDSDSDNSDNKNTNDIEDTMFNPYEQYISKLFAANDAKTNYEEYVNKEARKNKDKNKELLIKLKEEYKNNNNNLLKKDAIKNKSNKKVSFNDVIYYDDDNKKFKSNTFSNNHNDQSSILETIKEESEDETETYTISNKTSIINTDSSYIERDNNQKKKLKQFS